MSALARDAVVQVLSARESAGHWRTLRNTVFRRNQEFRTSAIQAHDRPRLSVGFAPVSAPAR